MGEERVQRRLAAILAADVVGYSRLMEADEQGTLERLKALRRELFQPKTKQYGGRIFKTPGDGALVEFASAVDAVASAIDIQRALAAGNSYVSEGERIALRIGVSLGDVIVEGGDLYGNGVNVAARMQTLAEPGGICISATVHEHAGNALDIAFEDLGDQNSNTLDAPVARAFDWAASVFLFRDRGPLDDGRGAFPGAPRFRFGVDAAPPRVSGPSTSVLPNRQYFVDELVTDSAAIMCKVGVTKMAGGFRRAFSWRLPRRRDPDGMLEV